MRRAFPVLADWPWHSAGTLVVLRNPCLSLAGSLTGGGTRGLAPRPREAAAGRPNVRQATGILVCVLCPCVLRPCVLAFAYNILLSPTAPARRAGGGKEGEASGRRPGSGLRKHLRSRVFPTPGLGMLSGPRTTALWTSLTPTPTTSTEHGTRSESWLKQS